jgi:hypothetical protein
VERQICEHGTRKKNYEQFTYIFINELVDHTSCHIEIEFYFLFYGCVPIRLFVYVCSDSGDALRNNAPVALSEGDIFHLMCHQLLQWPMAQIGNDVSLPFPDNCFLLGDKIYPNRHPVMTPYTRQQIARKPECLKNKCRKLNQKAWFNETYFTFVVNYYLCMYAVVVAMPWEIMLLWLCLRAIYFTWCAINCSNCQWSYHMLSSLFDVSVSTVQDEINIYMFTNIWRIFWFFCPLANT